MRACFIAAIFVSAALLFTVQPFTGKLLLPLAGGSPQVWNTCMVFFQAMLLAGYLYAHGITRLPIKFQGPVHLCVLAIAALMLPVDVAEVARSQAPDASAPTAWLLGLLITTVGLPFFAVSTTSPLLQSWFARTRDARAKDPYFLYVASNAGSVVGLLAYPLLIEPIMTRQAQAMSWTGGYGLFFLLIAGCMALVLAAARGTRAAEGASAAGAMESGGATSAATGAAPLDARPITWSRRFFWLGLALIPSSLMLGVTQYISTDLAAVPLLWVAPLLLYLVSFMVAFSNVVPVSAKWLGRVTPMVVAVMAVVLLTQARDPVVVIVLVHVLGFFVLAWMCHRRLAEDRPDPKHLTEFYLLMSVGGVLGGIFNALIAPTVFNVVLEYPLAIAAACFMTPQFSKDWRGAWSGGVRSRGVLVGSIVLGGIVVFSAVIVASRMIARGELDGFTRQAIALGGVPVTLSLLLLLVRGTPRFAVAIMLAMLVAPFLGTLQDLYVKRTFFGVHRVQRQVEGGMGLHRLLHGTTLHGVQFRTDLVTKDDGVPTPFGGPKLTTEARNEFLFERAAWDDLARLARRGRYQLLPTSYYHPKGPMGDVMQMLINANKLDQVALIGMGAGTLAAYAQPGTTMVFYEIDPAVNDIAHNQAFYTFISDAVREPTVRIGTILGDGRKMIEMEQPGVGPFRLIVVDAFSSDAIPVHLITKEAVEAYLKRTTPDGLIAFHISNRYFDLSPVTARIAKELGLVAFIRNDTIEDPEEQKRDSLWVVLARDKAHLGELATRNAMWTQMSADDSDPLWTDDYSNVLGVFVPLRDVLGRQK